ncbi:hypothetical protein FZP57_07760 [Methanothermobacter sp. THM-1]|nr:hypothetical protein FZP57_07760 [Methanothermobacter sp. THM-1]
MTTPRFSFFKKEVIDLNGVEVELEGYRVVDSEYVIPLMEKRNEALEISVKYNNLMKKIEGKTEEEITEEDARKVKEMKDRVDRLLVETSELGYRLAQRGLKRSLYRDEEDYKEAERDGRLTEYIDSLPDVEIPPMMVRTVVDTMLKLSNPELIGEPSDSGGVKGKKKKGSRRKKSGSTSKG